jgi:membrane-associated phospholipid phosphatase
MTTATPSPNRDNEARYWIAAPALVLGLLALATVAEGRNAALFVDWNRAALALPAFFWAGVTNIGSTAGAFALLSGWLAWRPRWIAAAVLAVPAGTLYTHGLKEFFDERRPAAVLPPEQIHIIGDALMTTSFPSGHSVTAFGFAAAVTLCGVGSARRRIGCLALALAMLVGFSRVAVGAHWPLDVFAGGAGGWLCGAIGVWWSARWRFWTTDRGVRVLAVLTAALSVLLFFEYLGYPEGVWAQYALAAWGLGGALFAMRSGASRAAA